MIAFEEEKSKILLDTMPYLRPLYIKGISSMYKILSISWKESLINFQNKSKKFKNNDNKNTNNDNELEEIKNKMFFIYSFMHYFYQMIDKGKLKKYEGLDYIYSKLNNFYTFSRQIISYKILDINFEEFNQINLILKLIIHVKLFYIFCEYDTYKNQQEFIDDLLFFLSPNEILNKNDENNDNNNITLNEEEMVIEDLIKDIKKENIGFDNIYLFVKNKYNFVCEKYKNIREDNKYNFFIILYESYFELKINDKKNDYNNINEESSDEEKENKNYKDDDNNQQSDEKKKKKKRKNKKKKKNKDISEVNINDDNKINIINDINKNEMNINKTNNIYNDNNNELSINIINNINDSTSINQNEIKINNINENNKNNTNINREEININSINEINDNKDEINRNRIEDEKKKIINQKITKIKTIQSLAKFTNKLINNSSFNENENDLNDIKKNSDSKLSIPKNKNDFEDIKIKFFEPLFPHLQQYKKINGNKKMTISSLIQLVFTAFEENYRREKEKLLKEIDNLKRAMNQMFIQIQLMGGGRDIFKSTLYYLILIFIPEEQNIPSFFTKVQKLIDFFQKKVNNDLLLLKSFSPVPGSNSVDNTNQIIKRLHQNSQYVLFIKSLFFMYKYFNYIVHLNKNEKLQKKDNNNNNNNEENNIDEDINSQNMSLVSKMNSKNIKYNLPVIKNFFPEENSIDTFNNKKDMIYPTFNFNDCFSSYSNFLDEMVTNEKTQIIIEQVIEKIEKENNEGDVPKFEINDLFQIKDGKKIFNLTGLDVQVIIHDIKKMKYKEETFENLVNSKTWEKSQQEN